MEVRFQDIGLYAWIGEDEHGSKEIGLKQAFCAVGMIPMVAVKEEKMSQDFIVQQLQEQANKYGKTIRLCKFVFQDEIITLSPK